MLKNEFELIYDKERSAFKLIIDMLSTNAVHMFSLMLREAKKAPDREGLWYHVANDGSVLTMLFVETDGKLVPHRGVNPEGGYWFECMDI